jgi:asparagine synthase (glutamine-hydrolysing)
MSIFAGIVSRKSGTRVPADWCEGLQQLISRHPSDQITCIADERFCLLKADVGAFGSPASYQAPSGTASMLVGEPLLSSVDQGRDASRARDLECLHRAWDDDNWDILKQVRGIFAATYYRPKTGTLCLVADKLGLRPIYYWSSDSWIVFSSALRILEALPFVPKVMKFRAVTEIACFGFPLGARTGYEDIWTIKAAQVIRFEDASCTSQQYWRWDAIPVSRRPESELLQEAHKRFLESVKTRLHGNRVVTSFLSGGLDSRCVVAALSGQAERIHTLNCSFPNTQDRVFGAKYAGQMGTIHQEEEMMISHPDFFQHISKFWETDPNRKQWLPERPRLIWSGDGGSVGMGHVYMTEKVVELLRGGDRRGAIREFLRAENKQIVRRLLNPAALAVAEPFIEQGIEEEFDDLHCEDPGRNLYIFLLLNDQRRHLANQYERIDLSHIDYVEPFFDSDFLSFITSAPLDLCLLHRFYNKWLKLFQAPVSTVPWQAYPGHEPCPLPQPPGLVSQWNNSKLEVLQDRFKDHLLLDSRTVLKEVNFPTQLLDRRYLRLAHLAYRFNLRDYGYVLEAAVVYNRYWGACGGKFVLS